MLTLCFFFFQLKNMAILSVAIHEKQKQRNKLFCGHGAHTVSRYPHYASGGHAVEKCRSGLTKRQKN